MTYREAFHYGSQMLAMADIAESMTDAWFLLEMACRIDRSFYYLHMEDELPEEQFSEYEIALKKRAEHVPLQYITGETEFMGLKFKVNSNVLIPRQDTETLVEEALKAVRPGMHVLDLCTGSGCIIVSILHNVEQVQGFATDISKQAINVAKENARMNDVSVLFERSDLFDHVTGTYDVIVSKDFLKPEDRVLLIDDFLANGSALQGLISLVHDAGAHLVGAGVCIEKAFQPGGDLIRAAGVRVESLARVKSMTPDGGVEFC